MAGEVTVYVLVPENGPADEHEVGFSDRITAEETKVLWETEFPTTPYRVIEVEIITG